MGVRMEFVVADRSKSPCELAVRPAEHDAVAFVEKDGTVLAPPILVPHLTMPVGGPQSPWLREIIERIEVPGTKPSPTNLAALKAGLFLVNDFFDESHSCSQSIEGLGPHHTGDYWHAILHRREPDYGNSKYWFRHVGRHPVFAALASEACRHLDSPTGTLSSKLKPWKLRLVADGRWDPFAFVDMCAASENDSELREWCEQVQYEEMLLLLESTYREVIDG